MVPSAFSLDRRALEPAHEGDSRPDSGSAAKINGKEFAEDLRNLFDVIKGNKDLKTRQMALERAVDATEELMLEDPNDPLNQYFSKLAWPTLSMRNVRLLVCANDDGMLIGEKMLKLGVGHHYLMFWNGDSIQAPAGDSCPECPAETIDCTRKIVSLLANADKQGWGNDRRRKGLAQANDVDVEDMHLALISSCSETSDPVIQSMCAGK